jgi:hypothetical protein
MWRWGIIKYGPKQFEIGELYDMKDNGVYDTYTETGVVVSSESAAGFVEILEQMLEDAKRYGVFTPPKTKKKKKA